MEGGKDEEKCAWVREETREKRQGVEGRESERRERERRERERERERERH